MRPTRRFGNISISRMVHHLKEYRCEIQRSKANHHFFRQLQNPSAVNKSATPSASIVRYSSWSEGSYFVVAMKVFATRSRSIFRTATNRIYGYSRATTLFTIDLLISISLTGECCAYYGTTIHEREISKTSFQSIIDVLI